MRGAEEDGAITGKLKDNGNETQVLTDGDPCETESKKDSEAKGRRRQGEEGARHADVGRRSEGGALRLGATQEGGTAEAAPRVYVGENYPHATRALWGMRGPCTKEEEGNWTDEAIIVLHHAHVHIKGPMGRVKVVGGERHDFEADTLPDIHRLRLEMEALAVEVTKVPPTVHWPEINPYGRWQSRWQQLEECLLIPSIIASLDTGNDTRDPWRQVLGATHRGAAQAVQEHVNANQNGEGDTPDREDAGTGVPRHHGHGFRRGRTTE